MKIFELLLTFGQKVAEKNIPRKRAGESIKQLCDLWSYTLCERKKEKEREREWVSVRLRGRIERNSGRFNCI